MPRGQHSEIAYESMNLSLGKNGLDIPSQEVAIENLSQAVYAAINESSEYPNLADVMNELREEIVEIKEKYNLRVANVLSGS